MTAKNKPFFKRKRCVLISTPFPRLEDGFIDGVPAICRIIEMHGTINVRYWVQFHHSNVGDTEFFDVLAEVYPGIDIERLSSKDAMFSREVFDLLGKIDNGVWVHENLATADVVSRFSDDSELLQSGSLFFGTSELEYDGSVHRSSFSFISSNAMVGVDSIEEAVESIKSFACCDSFRVPSYRRPIGKTPIVYGVNGGTVCWFKKKGDSEYFKNRISGASNIVNVSRTYDAGRYLVSSGLGLARFVDGFDTSNLFEILSWLSVNFWSKGFNGNIRLSAFMSSVGALIDDLYSRAEVQSAVGSRINGIRIPSKSSLLAMFHECSDLIPKQFQGQVANLCDIEHLYKWRDGYAIIHDPLYEPWRFQQPILEFCYLKYAVLFRDREFIRIGDSIRLDVSYDVMMFMRDINRDDMLQGHGRYREDFYDAITYLRNMGSVGANGRLFLLSDLSRKLNRIKYTL